MSNNMPAVRQEYFPLAGGLDLLTPQIAIASGKCFDAQNYEPEISGGYSRIDGYERFDGNASPTSAPYWIMQALGTLAAGNTITGLSSAATARVLAVVGASVVLARVVGTFAAAESLQVNGTSVAVSSTTAVQTSEPDPSNDADYRLRAANDLRADILVVPGSGAIRGVCVYKDGVYAFRDNAAGTAGGMWKATSTGWSAVALGNEIQFATATGQINVGDTITGGTSGATAQVVKALLRTGTWTASGVGTLIISTITGVWQSGEAIKVAAVSKSTSASLATAIIRAPGGTLEYVVANFTGSTDTTKLYGADGVNLAFEFDGVNYVPIRTGMTADTPAHITFHRFYLFLSFLGSVQLSAIGNPYAWTVVLGAAEIALGDTVTGFVVQGGTQAGSAMGIFTKRRSHTLYGSSVLDFNLVNSIYDIGFSAYTMQPVSNNTYGLTGRGIQALITTLTYGDFDYSSVSHEVQPLITAKLGTETASTSLKTRNQYRVYFGDGTGLAVGLTGDKINGLMPLNYGLAVRCMTSALNSAGKELTYFGSDDGYVYQDNIGTSFDGGLIEAWIRPAFNHSKSPQIRKRYRRAVFEVKPSGYSQVNIAYDLGYASASILAPVGAVNSAIFGGGFWDQVTWDQFTWDAPVFSSVSMSLSGTEKNISFLFYSNRAQDAKHTVQGITLMYTPQRSER